jgi:hypothetical protein
MSRSLKNSKTRDSKQEKAGKRSASRQRRQSTNSGVGKDDPEQSRLFIKKAKEVEADEKDSKDAERLLGHLASKPPREHKK